MRKNICSVNIILGYFTFLRGCQTEKQLIYCIFLKNVLHVVSDLCTSVQYGMFM